MDAPFVYGRIALDMNYTDRDKETLLLKNNFLNLINTVIISPRRWGKTSLVNKVKNELGKEYRKELIICHLDVFNCRSEEHFYKAYSNAILKTTLSTWEKFIAGSKKYLGRFAPSVSFSNTAQTFELSFGIDMKEPNLSVDDILDLPQILAKDLNKKIVVCIDEFQNIHGYADSLAFQRTLRAHWQTHDKVATVCMAVNGIC
ncbi:hypothetical protein AGMMS49982_23480 [Bacteroidia bacterium]|nr:hypothetical protein AGMMS49982_23480 [Bacteroidia bacterium]